MKENTMYLILYSFLGAYAIWTLAQIIMVEPWERFGLAGYIIIIGVLGLTCFVWLIAGAFFGEWKQDVSRKVQAKNPKRDSRK